jgi:G:T/U-mismatch repair DNA glycosylase
MHTLVIGTSKSKNEDAYYIEAKDKFWNSLFLSGFTDRQLLPHEYRELINKGVGFAELAFNHQFTGKDKLDIPYSQDKQLENDLSIVLKGIPDLFNFIRKTGVKNLVFNGKTALACFLEFYSNGVILNLNSSFIRDKKLSYGKCLQWEGLDVYLMPNLSASAGNEWKIHNGLETWTNLWKQLKAKHEFGSELIEEVQLRNHGKNKTHLTQKQKMVLGLSLFFISISCILIYLLITKNIITK